MHISWSVAVRKRRHARYRVIATVGPWPWHEHARCTTTQNGGTTCAASSRRKTNSRRQTGRCGTAKRSLPMEAGPARPASRGVRPWDACPPWPPPAPWPGRRPRSSPRSRLPVRRCRTPMLRRWAFGAPGPLSPAGMNGPDGVTTAVHSTPAAHAASPLAFTGLNIQRDAEVGAALVAGGWAMQHWASRSPKPAASGPSGRARGTVRRPTEVGGSNAGSLQPRACPGRQTRHPPRPVAQPVPEDEVAEEHAGTSGPAVGQRVVELVVAQVQLGQRPGDRQQPAHGVAATPAGWEREKLDRARRARPDAPSPGPRRPPARIALPGPPPGRGANRWRCRVLRRARRSWPGRPSTPAARTGGAASRRGRPARRFPRAGAIRTRFVPAHSIGWRFAQSSSESSAVTRCDGSSSP